MTAQHLLLRLEAPLISFGSVSVDEHGFIQRWPAVSMLCGLFGNALGYRRTDAEQLDALQRRIVWAARLDRPGVMVQDFQTAQIGKNDKAWTTRGRPEVRGGGAATYESPHIRRRDYWADASIAVAVRLEPADEAPSLDALAQALRAPARPLFIGRKSCLPSCRILEGAVEAGDALAALAQAAFALDSEPVAAVFFNDVRAKSVAIRRHRASDERRFELDVHAGQVTVFEGRSARGENEGRQEVKA
jgi:CRISPR system Cascade subunit CasD